MGGRGDTCVAFLYLFRQQNCSVVERIGHGGVEVTQGPFSDGLRPLVERFRLGAVALCGRVLNILMISFISKSLL